MSAWWQQIRRGAVRQRRADDCGNAITRHTSAEMNCSCLQQKRRCNRLTCYRKSTGSGSSHCEALPLFIALAILMLAMPLIDAAVFKRSVAETNTSDNVTTAFIPAEVVDEVEFTPVVTPQIANVQTTEENKQAADVEVPIVNGLATASVDPSTTRQINQTILLDLSQDVNNEISQAANEDSAEAKVFAGVIRPQFDYTSSLLTENLEESIRNSVKNEIELKHDIGHLRNITTFEELRKLDAEVLAIQNAQRRGNAHTSGAVGTLTKLTPSSPDSKYIERFGTEKSPILYSTTAETDLSIYFPVQDQLSTEKLLGSNQRDARNLNATVNGNSQIFNENADNENQITEDVDVRNIDEKINKNHDESLSVGKNSESNSFIHISEAALYSHETNEITEEVVRHQLDIDNSQTMFGKSDHSNEGERSLDVETEENPKDDDIVGSLSVDLLENLNTTQEDQSNKGMENIDGEIEEKSASPAETAIDQNTTQVTAVEEDEALLSIVLNENLAATESAEPLEDDPTEDIIHLEENNNFLAEEAGTTVEPDTVKSVHIVIKKPGVELDDGQIEPALFEVGEETTMRVDMEKDTPELKNSYEKDDTAETTEVSIVKDENVESAQGIQNYDAIKETTLQLELNNNEEEVSEGIEVNERHPVEGNNPIDAEDEIFVEETNGVETIHNERSQPDEKAKELDTEFKENQDASESEYFVHTNNELDHHAEWATTVRETTSASSAAPTAEPVIIQAAEHDSVIPQSISITELREQRHRTLLSTTETSNFESSSPTVPDTTDAHSTTAKESEASEDESINTDDPDIVPIVVGVSAGQGDVTASTKGSRSINTQTHQSMLLRQMDDVLAATLFETYPPHNAGQTFNDHLEAESGGGIGKALPVGIVSEATSTSVFSRSGLIIVLCSAVAFMFLLASVAVFLVSFQRQHGTLDIEMQEQRCGKDNLDEDDEEDEEAGTCTKLLEIELPKSSIVSVACEEMEECL